MMSMSALEIAGLAVSYVTSRGPVQTLRDVDLRIAPGEIVGVVGESGSGKSTLAAAISGTLAPNASRDARTLSIAGADLASATADERRAIRRDRLGLISQNPITSMDPTRKIGRAFSDIGLDLAAAEAALQAVGLLETHRILHSFPHQLSGGMAQRVGIALAMARRPRLLVADEPTSALNANVARAVLERLVALARENDAALLMITHDLTVVREHCSRVLVMYRGEIVEQGAVEQVVSQPKAEYTKRLLAATSLRDAEPREPRPTSADIAVSISEANVEFVSGPPWDRTRRRALRDVSVEIRRGEILGVVGASGSGKSTLCRLMLGLQSPDSGSVLLRGRPLREERRRNRGSVQVVLQHPDWALNPSLRVGASIAEPLRVVGRPDRSETRTRVRATMERLALDPDLADRFPHELSGGQRQRASIARALIAKPELIVFDEAVSSLDVSVQAQVLREIAAVHRELGFTAVFVSHDAGAVAYVADRVIRMEDGCATEVT